MSKVFTGYPHDSRHGLSKPRFVSKLRLCLYNSLKSFQKKFLASFSHFIVIESSMTRYSIISCHCSSGYPVKAAEASTRYASYRNDLLLISEINSQSSERLKSSKISPLRVKSHIQITLDNLLTTLKYRREFRRKTHAKFAHWLRNRLRSFCVRPPLRCSSMFRR